MENVNRNNEKLRRILLHFYRIGLQLDYPKKKTPDELTDKNVGQLVPERQGDPTSR